MKVLWIADFGLHHNSGGAQRTNDFVIQKGIELGHSIDFFYYDTPYRSFDKYDIIISNNMELLHKRKDIFDSIISHKNHVRYEHDSNSYLSQTDRELLFESTNLNIFLSNYHLTTFQKLYGNIFQKNEIITPYIDTGVFKNYCLTRENKILYLGFMHYFKGTQNFFNYVIQNPSKKFVMAAWGSQDLEYVARSFHNVEWLGKVAFDRMPDLLNNYTTLYYHPTKFEPFCRSVAEAAFCGMKLNCSDNIGAVHDFDLYGIDGVKQISNCSTKKFWDIVS